MTAKAAKNKATTLHSLIVRSRGICEACGERDYSKLQCAHIVRRGYSATRTDIANAFALCASCHIFFTNRGEIEWGWFVDEKIGRDAYYALKQKAEAGVIGQTPLMFWRSEAERLDALWKEIVRATEREAS